MDPSEVTSTEVADLEETMFEFFQDNFDEGTTVLELRTTNAGPNLSSSGDPFLFELTTYTSPNIAGSRKLRGTCGPLYECVTKCLSDKGDEFIEFLNYGGIVVSDFNQVEPPSEVPSLAPSSFPTSIPSSGPTGFPIAQPSYLPTNSPKPTTIMSNHPSSKPTVTSLPTQSLLPTADVAPWMVEMLKRVNFERERGNYDFKCNCTYRQFNIIHLVTDAQ